MGLFKFGRANSKRSHLPANLQDDNQRFKTIVDSIEDGVILIDDQLAIQFINPGAATICGWGRDEGVGLSIKSVLQLVTEKGEPLPAHDNPFVKALESGENKRIPDAYMRKRDGQQICITLNLSPLKDDKGKVSALVAVVNDITVQKAEEQQRADFISTASHEMRTPVAAIEGYLALALNEKVSTIDSRAKGYIEKAHTSTQHLGRLFQDLLTSAKAEDGRLTSHPKVVEFGDFMEQLSNDLRLVAEKKGLAVEFVTNTHRTIDATKGSAPAKVIRPLYYVYVDPDRFREVVTNLFDNAVKYTPEGKVSIGLTGNDKVVQCYIRDTGPGIPQEDLPHLFQKFYRVDNSATRTIGGTGLGLFICRKIVELYNGRIWAESELGEGSTFYINLPRLSTQQANQLQISSANAPVKQTTQTDVNSKTAA